MSFYDQTRPSLPLVSCHITYMYVILVNIFVYFDIIMVSLIQFQSTKNRIKGMRLLWCNKLQTVVFPTKKRRKNTLGWGFAWRKCFEDRYFSRNKNPAVKPSKGKVTYGNKHLALKPVPVSTSVKHSSGIKSHYIIPNVRLMGNWPV